MFNQFVLIILQVLTLYSLAHLKLHSHLQPPKASSKIVDPPLHPSICICTSIKLLEFGYSCYSSSFTSFLSFVHCLFKPSSYKKAIFYPFLQQAMDEEPFALHKIDTWDLVPLPPSKSVVG